MNIQMNATRFRRLSVLGIIAGLGAAAFSCSSSKDEPGIGPSGAARRPHQGGSGAAVAGSSPSSSAGTITLEPSTEMPDGPCTGLECQVPACTGMPATTITGKVYDPAGKVPLYNVLVYVPNSPVVPFTDGAKCDRCDASVLNPVTSAVTAEARTFVLKGAPAGQNVPVVMQVGKWRRQITVASVAPCADTRLRSQVTRCAQ